jgi:enoyl-CoA hydratase/carnithine racemase
MKKQVTDLANLAGYTYRVSDHIAVITINRPHRGNALDVQMEREIEAIWEDVRENPDIRVAVMTAAGEKHFCTGGDVGGMETDSEDTALVNRPLRDAVHWSPHQNRVWKPVICAVNGLVNGAGLHFVVDSDIIVASENAVFMDSHVNIGLVGAIENIGLTKRLPLGSALRMTLQGRKYRMPASRAYQLGLVDELVPKVSDLMPKALEIARDIAANSPQAMALSKEAIWTSLEMGYTQSLEHGWALLRVQWSHPDFDEGPKAFAEKRAAQWNSDPNARR